MDESTLNEVINEWVMEVVEGVQIKTIAKRLMNNGASPALAEKLLRIIEIRANELMHYKPKAA
ncbi:MAG: hypothetical protein V7756_09730 [Halopseudomonas sp.]|uniref:hypothetical protein n=1 Tax=Halopseudomonas sp. TaxID=2901191 RepID=UPI0030025027